MLRGPRRIVVVHVVIWGFGALFFGALNAIYSFEAGMRVATLVAFAGASVCAFVYLIAERQLRPAAARALAYGIGDKRLGPGIKTRVMIAWAMAIALPILGLIIIGISTLAESDFTADELALVMIALGGSTLLVGFYALFLASRAIADPVVSLRRAVGEVEDGELDVCGPRLRRIGDRPAPGRVQPDGRGAARARAHPRPLRPPRRRGRGEGGARERHRARRRDPGGLGPVR